VKKLILLILALTVVCKADAQLVTRYNQIVNNTPMFVAITEPSGDSWSSSTVLTLSGGTGASIVSQTFVPADSLFGRLDTMYLQINPGTVNGTLTVCDPATSNCINYTVRAPVTFYIRTADGGTRWDAVTNTSGQCDGLGDAAYPGTGTDQHCGWSDIRNGWSDGNRCVDDLPSSMCWFWTGAGGDTFIVRGGHTASTSLRIGQNGPNSGDYYGLAGNPYGAGMPTPNAGISTKFTQILGENYASCHAQGPSALRTFINSGYGTFSGINLGSTSYVQISCFDLSQHGNCTQGTGPVVQCNTNFPLDDYSTTGIASGNTASNILLSDIYEHGMASVGMIGPTGDGFTMSYMSIVGNAGAGWNSDNGQGNQNALGIGHTLVQNFVIAWNGCKEQYPTGGFQNCSDDSSGGYGDGFGTATVVNTGTGWQVHFDQGQAYNNTQDGLDALHLIGGGSSMTITRVLAYGNMGQQIKVGGSDGIAINNVIYTNCNSLRYAGNPNTPAGVSITSFTKDGTNAIFTTPSTSSLTVGQPVALNNFTSSAGTTFNLSTTNVVSSSNFTATTFQIPWGDGISGSGTESTAVFTVWNGRLSSFCRAFSGNVLEDGPSSPVVWQYNTVFSANTIQNEIDGTGDTAWSIDYRNNVYYGTINGVNSGYPSGGTGDYPNPIFDTTSPPIFLQSGSVFSHNDTFNSKAGYTCPNTGANETNALCVDPQLTDESWHSFGVPTSFAPLSGSPLLSAGTPISGVTTDFLGNPRDPVNPTIGAIEGTGTPQVATPVGSPVPGSYSGAQTLTLSTTTPSAVICYTTDGSTPTEVGNLCSGGTTQTYTIPFTVSSTSIITALGTLPSFLDSTLFIGTYTIANPGVPRTIRGQHSRIGH
jgi:Chitobiase/beta-hexosaminidase C-terminal domain